MGGGAVELVAEEVSHEEAKEILIRAGFQDDSALLDSEFVGGEGGFGTVVMVGLFAALGGMLFGLDIGYIAGVESMPSFTDDVLNGAPMDTNTTGMVTGMFALGAVIAALPPVIGAIVDKCGRKGSITLGGMVFVLGASSQALAPLFLAPEGSSARLTWMYIGRFVAGASVGLLSANIPIYQGEIAPPSYRGMIVALYQLAITIGILIANLLSYVLKDSAHGWSISIMVQLIPGLSLALGGLFLPGSPRWLVSKMRRQEAHDTLRRIRSPQEDIRLELAQIYKEYEREIQHGTASWGEFCTGMNGRLLGIGIALQMLQQMCGLNMFMYYGPKIFAQLFKSSNDSFLFTFLNSIVNMLSTFPAIFFVDKAGRMKLLMLSAVGMALCCVVLAIVGQTCFSHHATHACLHEGSCAAPADAAECPAAAKWVAVGSIFFFICNFAYGWGPVVWVYCAEIFSLKYRTKANGATTDANWVGNFFIAYCPPFFISHFGFGTFWIFAAINCLAVAMSCVLPETKGKSLEDIQVMFKEYFYGEAEDDEDSDDDEDSEEQS